MIVSLYRPCASGRTKQPLDSAKVRFEGGAAAVTDRLASELRGKGVRVHLDCTVHHISTAHSDAVRVEAKQVRICACLSGKYRSRHMDFFPFCSESIHCTTAYMRAVRIYKFLEVNQGCGAILTDHTCLYRVLMTSYVYGDRTV